MIGVKILKPRQRRGYAKRSKAEQRQWAKMIEGYLTERQELDEVIHLIDGEIGPTALDLQTLIGALSSIENHATPPGRRAFPAGRLEGTEHSPFCPRVDCAESG